MTALVIDASIAVKWVVEEEGTAEALELRQRALVAPDLLTAECANILWKKVRRAELSMREAVFAAGLLARADIEFAAMRPYLEPAIRIAIALDHPAYDCIYIALAEELGLQLVTADTALVRRAGLRASGRFAARVVDLADSARWQS